jgi:DNA repair protein RadC
LQEGDTPEKVAAYWKLHIATNPYFEPERECLAVLLLNTRRRAKGHQLVSTGTLDTLLVSPTSIFRLAVMASVAAFVICYNHPSGGSTPSQADIKVTRDLIRAGQLLKVEVLDHVVIGQGNYSSFRAMDIFTLKRRGRFDLHEQSGIFADTKTDTKRVKKDMLE